jgi:hypothetical protein
MLQEEAVSGSHIAPDSIAAAHLRDKAIENRHLTDGSISANNISEGSITQAHLRDQIVGTEQIAGSAVTADKIAFTPVRAARQPRQSRGAVLQQYGTASFAFGLKDESVSVRIPFEEPYADSKYAITAMTNHPACYAVLLEQTPEAATVLVLRARFDPEPSGMIAWIAIGEA